MKKLLITLMILFCGGVCFAETWVVRVDDCVGNFYKYSYPAGYAFDDDQRDSIISMHPEYTIEDFVNIYPEENIVSIATAISEEQIYCTRQSFTKELKRRLNE